MSFKVKWEKREVLDYYYGQWFFFLLATVLFSTISKFSLYLYMACLSAPAIGSNFSFVFFQKNVHLFLLRLCQNKKIKKKFHIHLFNHNVGIVFFSLDWLVYTIFRLVSLLVGWLVGCSVSLKTMIMAHLSKKLFAAIVHFFCLYVRVLFGNDPKHKQHVYNKHTICNCHSDIRW